MVSVATNSREPLIDGHGRAIGDIRISVTDRCNFRCQYCMPAEALPWLARDDVLTFEEIERHRRRGRVDGRARPATDGWRDARGTRPRHGDVWRVAHSRGWMDFINPVSEPFCSDCKRIR
jgi:molybdenum cofactor biosynthesis enzyme MoaA